MTVLSHATSRNRLRFIQQICRAADLDAIVAVPGIDGGYNAGSHQLVKYLFLHASGTELIDPTINSPNDVLEDVFVVISPNEVGVYYAADSADIVEPVLHTWPNVKSKVLVATDLEDMERAELFKIFAFAELVKGKDRIGCPLTPGWTRSGIKAATSLTDQFEVESWPLIQAYGLDEVGAGGFFSMKHKVINATPAVQSVLGHIDALYTRQLLEDSTTSLQRQWKDFADVLDLCKRPIQRQELSELQVGDALLNLVAYGNTGRSTAQPAAHARVLFGTNTHNAVQSSVHASGEDSVLTTAPKHTSSALHMTAEVREPFTGITVARTYLLRSCATGNDRPCPVPDLAQLEPSSRAHVQESMAAEALQALYWCLTEAQQAGAVAVQAMAAEQGAAVSTSLLTVEFLRVARRTWVQLMNTGVAGMECVADLVVAPKLLCAAEKMQGYVEVVDAMTQNGLLGADTKEALAAARAAADESSDDEDQVVMTRAGDEKGVMQRRRQMLVVRLELSHVLLDLATGLLSSVAAEPEAGGGAVEGPEEESVDVGSLVVADTFILEPPVITSEGRSHAATDESEPGMTNTALARPVCLTQSIPRWSQWAVTSEESAGASALEQILSNQANREAVLHLGAAVTGPLPGVSLCLGGSIVPAYSGILRLFDNGLLFRHHGMGPLPIAISRHVSGVHFLSGSDVAKQAHLPSTKSMVRSALEAMGSIVHARPFGASILTMGDSTDTVTAVEAALDYAPDVLVLEMKSGAPQYTAQHSFVGSGRWLAFLLPADSTAKRRVLDILSAWRGIVRSSQRAATTLGDLEAEFDAKEAAHIASAEDDSVSHLSEGSTHTMTELPDELLYGYMTTVNEVRTTVLDAQRAVDLAVLADARKGCGRYGVPYQQGAGATVSAVYHSARMQRNAAAVAERTGSASDRGAQVPVTIVLGMFDSGRASVASLLKEYTSSDVTCQVVIPPFERTLRWDVEWLQAHVTKAVQTALNAGADGDSDAQLSARRQRPPHVVVVAPAHVDASVVCTTVMACHPAVAITSCIAVIGLDSLKVDARQVNYKPGLLDSVARGWVDTVVLTRYSDTTDAASSAVTQKLRAINPDLRFLRVRGGRTQALGISAEAASDLVSSRAFMEPAAVLARTLLYPNASFVTNWYLQHPNKLRLLGQSQLARGDAERTSLREWDSILDSAALPNDHCNTVSGAFIPLPIALGRDELVAFLERTVKLASSMADMAVLPLSDDEEDSHAVAHKPSGRFGQVWTVKGFVRLTSDPGTLVQVHARPGVEVSLEPVLPHQSKAAHVTLASSLAEVGWASHMQPGRPRAAAGAGSADSGAISAAGLFTPRSARSGLHSARDEQAARLSSMLPASRLMFAGFGLDSTAVLKHFWANLIATRPPIPTAPIPKTVATLTPAQRDHILEAKAAVDLPPEIMFDGRRYIDMEGHASHLHPSAGAILEATVEDINVEVERVVKHLKLCKAHAQQELEFGILDLRAPWWDGLQAAVADDTLIKLALKHFTAMHDRSGEAHSAGYRQASYSSDSDAAHDDA